MGSHWPDFLFGIRDVPTVMHDLDLAEEGTGRFKVSKIDRSDCRA